MSGARPRWGGGMFGRVDPLGRASLALVAVAWLVAACASLPGADVTESPSGDLIVEVRQEQSFTALAIHVYEDAQLARAVADVAGLPYEESVPAGSVLTLPPKRAMRERAAADRKADRLVEDANESLRKGRWTDAVERFRAVLEIRPERADARGGLGVALLRAGELEEAHTLLAEAAAHHPRDADTRWAYGSVLLKLDHFEAALSELSAAVELDETHARASYDLARTLHELGRHAEARIAYQRFLYAFPSDPWADTARRSLEELEGS